MLTFFGFGDLDGQSEDVYSNTCYGKAAISTVVLLL